MRSSAAALLPLYRKTRNSPRSAPIIRPCTSTMILRCPRARVGVVPQGSTKNGTTRPTQPGQMYCTYLWRARSCCDVLLVPTLKRLIDQLVLHMSVELVDCCSSSVDRSVHFHFH